MLEDRRERLRQLLLDELRDATATRLSAGADPGEMTAELSERLRLLRTMWRASF